MQRRVKPKRRVLLVTGLSGAGLSTTLKALEDLGYKAVDNLPLALVEDLLALKAGGTSPVAIGIDTRAWDFSAQKLLRESEALKARADIDAKLVFVDCEDAVLQRRYTETRRLHPLATDRPVKDGISQERQLLRACRRAADHVIDTSDIKAHDLRRLTQGLFGLKRGGGLVVTVTSFGFRNGLPREADLVLDVRFLDNPHWDAKLRPLSGRDAAVIRKIEKDPEFAPFFNNTCTLLKHLLPRYDREGKNYLTIAVGCTGGRHRSVFTAERLQGWLAANGFSAAVRHRDLERWTADQGLPAAAANKNKNKSKKKNRRSA